MPAQLKKARILNHDTNDQLVFECQFNPTDYSFAKSNNWKSDPLTGSNVPPPHFTGGGLMTMKFQLLFDTYKGEEAGMQDVRDYTEPLLNLMQISPKTKNVDAKTKKGRPPVVTFFWGDYWSFKGVIKSINLKFTLFTSEGRPVRATADVELQQSEEEGTFPKQNPTSGGDGVRLSRVVQHGDTLDLIAYHEYGDANKWRLLAQANSMEDPRRLHPGQRLQVPDQ